MSAAMFLFPKQEKFEQQRIFMDWWWTQQHDTLNLSSLDSIQIQHLPISTGSKKTLDFRRRRDWHFKDMQEFIAAPGLSKDSLWWSRGTLKFKARQTTPNYHFRSRSSTNSTRQYANPYSDRSTEIPKRERPKPIDLATADSALLVSTKGIGAWTAKQILSYRESYGYIASLEHLKTSTYLGNIWRDEWDTLFIPSNDTAHLSLNSSSFQDLQHFPEFNYYQTKRIAFYRESFGRITWSEIVSWEEFEGVDTNFLKLYVSE